jgi:hypothetical protein
VTDPWAALRERPHLQLLVAPIPETGRYYHRLRTIVLRSGMLLAEQRATLWHELVHADRGDEPCGDHDARQELSCHREAARRAIDLHDLADAVCWSDSHEEQAEQLKTTVDLLETRLHHLHPSERGYLQRRRAMKEQGA